MLNKQKAFPYKRLFSATLANKIFIVKYFHLFSIAYQNNDISERNCLNKLTFNNLNRLNHSSTMNNTVTVKLNTFLNYSL